MPTMPALARVGCWLLSAGAHVFVFVATGHAPPSSPPAAPRDLPEPVLIDVAPEASEPVASAPRERPVSFAPSHRHTSPNPTDRDARPHDPGLGHPPFALPAATEATSGALLARAHFTMVVTSDRPGATGTAPAAVAPSGDVATGSDAAPLPEESVSSPARLTTPMSPKYPAEARAQDIEADVTLAIVVASTGEVVDARVVAPAGLGFDQEALRAVRAARFIPAQRDGRRVAVRMRWSVSFRLR